MLSYDSDAVPQLVREHAADLARDHDRSQPRPSRMAEPDATRRRTSGLAAVVYPLFRLRPARATDRP